jgi:ATP/maltotriose-dependent transcriptional regulator MalT
LRDGGPDAATRVLSQWAGTSRSASHLSVSLNTVKTHVRSIYRRLAAVRRREAWRKARDLNLL